MSASPSDSQLINHPPASGLAADAPPGENGSNGNHLQASADGSALVNGNASVPVDQPAANTAAAGGADLFLGMRRPDVLAVNILLAIVVALCAAHWLRLSGFGLAPVEIDRLPGQELQYQIDVNSAAWVEWAQLGGIGEVLGRRIVQDREQNGPFQSIDDLRRVKGVGQKTLERLRPYLTLEAPPALPPEYTDPAERVADDLEQPVP